MVKSQVLIIEHKPNLYHGAKERFYGYNLKVDNCDVTVVDSYESAVKLLFKMGDKYYDSIVTQELILMTPIPYANTELYFLGLKLAIIASKYGVRKVLIRSSIHDTTEESILAELDSLNSLNSFMIRNTSVQIILYCEKKFLEKCLRNNT